MHTRLQSRTAFFCLFVCFLRLRTATATTQVTDQIEICEAQIISYLVLFLFFIYSGMNSLSDGVNQLTWLPPAPRVDKTPKNKEQVRLGWTARALRHSDAADRLSVWFVAAG